MESSKFLFSTSCSGVATAAAGLIRWRKRQGVRDKMEDMNLERLARDLNPEEVLEKARLETSMEEDIPQATESSAASKEEPRILISPESQARAYIQVEEVLYKKLTECLDSGFVIRMNKRIGRNIYDFILQARISLTPDIVIEVKYIRHGFKTGWLSEVAHSLSLATELYTKAASRQAVPRLMIILGPDTTLRDVQITKMIDRVHDRFPDWHPHLRIIHMADWSLETLSCSELKRFIV